jgi:hypothetical protein
MMMSTAAIVEAGPRGRARTGRSTSHTVPELGRLVEITGGSATVTKGWYEIRVVGALGPAAREAFAGLAIEVEPTSTVISGELEQAELHALLDRVRALRLELVEIQPRRRHLASHIVGARTQHIDRHIERRS